MNITLGMVLSFPKGQKQSNVLRDGGHSQVFQGLLEILGGWMTAKQ